MLSMALELNNDWTPKSAVAAFAIELCVDQSEGAVFCRPIPPLAAMVHGLVLGFHPLKGSVRHVCKPTGPNGRPVSSQIYDMTSFPSFRTGDELLAVPVYSGSVILGRISIPSGPDAQPAFLALGEFIIKSPAGIVAVRSTNAPPRVLVYSHPSGIVSIVDPEQAIERRSQAALPTFPLPTNGVVTKMQVSRLDPRRVLFLSHVNALGILGVDKLNIEFSHSHNFRGCMFDQSPTGNAIAVSTYGGQGVDIFDGAAFMGHKMVRLRQFGNVIQGSSTGVLWASNELLLVASHNVILPAKKLRVDSTSQVDQSQEADVDAAVTVPDWRFWAFTRFRHFGVGASFGGGCLALIE